MWQGVSRLYYVGEDEQTIRILPFELTVPAGTTRVVVVCSPSWREGIGAAFQTVVRGDRLRCRSLRLPLGTNERKKAKTLAFSVSLDGGPLERCERELCSESARKQHARQAEQVPAEPRLARKRRPSARQSLGAPDDVVGEEQEGVEEELIGSEEASPPKRARLAPAASPPAALVLSRCPCGREAVGAARCYVCTLKQVLVAHDAERARALLARQERVRRLALRLADQRRDEEAEASDVLERLSRPAERLPSLTEAVVSEPELALAALESEETSADEDE